ncbi:ATP-dependent RNA helicase DbpA [Luteimonas sp. SX5]|uniref:ATP-dependent RNA helicase DbpA n=1 Tax=Luteimonas galliterrae TaxID=2940486 RepID=A0ABT0MHS4_9GAMM|nr:ATP-dependent RNA helicase DbpA [Luteimonas galliterrae]MCL1633850.1 ATP-dependent RNA helicase DbpA [Luteimonas galliterrae]
MTAFAALPLSPALLQGLESLEFADTTPIQAQALPAILDGRDLIAQAPTGSGKTIAFALGLLQRVDPQQIQTQALVLCPTRELADQVGKAIRRLAVGIPNLKLSLLCGGIPLGPQLASLAHAPHVVVGTPGRIQELLRKQALGLAGVRTLVLDEADRMLDMGFEEAIRDIVGKTPKTRQTLLFSATYPEAVRGLGRRMLRDAVEVTVGGESETPAIEQWFYEVDASQKPAALAGLLIEHRPESSVVFCNMRRDTEALVSELMRYGFSPLALHGDMEQRDRDEVLVKFANRSCNVLVASDVAARGLDVKDIGAVINYELPTDPDVYTHRIGRTARAGRSGLALSLCAPPEIPRALALEKLQGVELRWRRAPMAGKQVRNAPQAPMATLQIDAGRTDKLRPGDVMGALTGRAGLPAEAVGKIDVFATRAYVAVARAEADHAVAQLRDGGIKGRKFRVRKI